MYLQVSLREYEKSRRAAAWKAELPASAGTYRLELGEGLCAVRVSLCEDGTCLTGEAEFTFLRPTALAGTVAVELCAADWDREKYVFAPGAVYAGNRFSSQKLPYPPYAQVKKEEALTHPPVITDIPRLSDTEPVSKIELRSGDMTTPAIGYFSPRDRQGVLLMTTHLANGDYTGLSVYENLPEQQALFALSCPAVREETKYFFGERADGTGFSPTATQNPTTRAAGLRRVRPSVCPSFWTFLMRRTYGRFSPISKPCAARWNRANQTSPFPMELPMKQ